MPLTARHCLSGPSTVQVFKTNLSTVGRLLAGQINFLDWPTKEKVLRFLVTLFRHKVNLFASFQA
jgi:hypothetical protein